MKLTCYPLSEAAVPIVPGRPERDWMEHFRQKQPYRCLPLVIANTSGWELQLPIGFRATWNGGPLNSDVQIEGPFGLSPNAHTQFVVSHFGGGTLTFHTHYLFKTEPGWDLWVGGAPNFIKHGIQPLTGIVETSWLPQPFTMNWRFTAPGSVSFAAGEPFAMIMPVPHAAIDEFEPVIEDLATNPELRERSYAWQQSRTNFLTDPAARNSDNPAASWQKHYFKGVYIDETPGPEDHVHKRRLKAPRRADEKK